MKYDFHKLIKAYWHFAVLLILPLLVLFTFCIYSFNLNQEAQAFQIKSDSRRLVSSVNLLLDNKLRDRLNSPGNNLCLIDANLRLLQPPDYSILPDPSDNLSEYDRKDFDDLNALLNWAREVEGNSHDIANLIYNAGLGFLKKKRTDDANGAFHYVVEKYPEAVTPSGMPIAPLANLKVFKIFYEKAEQGRVTRDEPDWLDDLLRNANLFDEQHQPL